MATLKARPQLSVVPASRAPESPTWDDAALVALVRAGERDAVRELYRRYAGLVDRMVVRMTGFVTDREDLIQDVFVRVLDGIEDLREPRALKSWICGIAVRRGQEFRRERKRAPLGHDDPSSLATPSRERDSESAMELRRVYHLLDQLDGDERAAFVLRRIEGMELLEIAEVVGTSLATVKRRLVRAETAFTKLAQNDAFLSSRLRQP
jgi:RNA polymerase sigma-70 factor (ECF subfamily)